MKTASIPSLRVSPELRKAAERVLRDGETLSGFVESSIRDQIQHRENQAAFIKRGLAARDEAHRAGKYFTIEETLEGLDDMRAEYDAQKNK